MTELEPTLLPGAMSSTRAIAVSPNGLRLACVTMDHLVIWDLVQRIILASHDKAGAEGVIWASDDALLVGRYDGVDQLDALTGARSVAWEQEQFGFVYDLAGLPDGSIMVTGSETVVVLKDHAVLAELGPWPQDGWNERPQHVDVHPNGSAFALSFNDHGRIVDRSGEELAWFDEVRSMRFSADGATLLTMGYSETTMFDWPRMDRARPLPFRLDDARPVPAGWLGWDHESATLFDEAGEEVWSSRYYDGIGAITVHGSRFYTGSVMQWIGVRDVAAGELLTILPAGAGQRIHAMAFDDEGEHFVAADDAGRLTLWNFKEARAVSMIDTSSLQDSDAALEVATLRHVDTLWVAEGALHVVSGKRYIWPNLGAEELGSVSPIEDDEHLDEISADRQHALIEDYESEATFLVRLEDGERIAVLPPYDRYSERVVIEDGAEHLLFVDIAGEGTTLRIWNVERCRYEQELHIDLPTEHVTFEPEGSVVGWLYPIFDWESAEDEMAFAPTLFFRWEPETGDVIRWFEAPPWRADFGRVIFGDDAAVFGERGPAMLLDLESLKPAALTSVPTHCVALHAETGRVVAATEHGVIALIDRVKGTTTSVCTTADGSTWSFRDGDLQLDPSEWAAR